MLKQPIQLPTFQAALERHPEFLADLPVNTAWRYRRGLLPTIISRLIKQPALLRALADDAERQQAAPAEQPAQ